MSQEANTSSTVSNGSQKPINMISEFCPEKDNWFLWKERFDIFLSEAEYSQDKQKTAVLLRVVGVEAYSVLHNLCDPVIPIDKKYEELCKLLESQFMPVVIVYHERKKFYQAEKMETESISAWFLRVKKLAAKCKFGAQLDVFVTDRFVCGLQGKLFERLCEEDETLKLIDALKKATIAETRLTNRKVADSEVNFVHRQKGNSSNKFRDDKGQTNTKA